MSNTGQRSVTQLQTGLLQLAFQKSSYSVQLIIKIYELSKVLESTFGTWQFDTQILEVNQLFREALTSSHPRLETSQAHNNLERNPKVTSKLFKPEEVQDILLSTRSENVLGDLFTRSIHHWNGLTVSYINYIQNMIRESIMISARAAFDEQINTPLWNHVEKTIDTYLSSAFEDHTTLSMSCLKMQDQDIVNTLDKGLIDYARKAALQAMQEDRCNDRVAFQIEAEERSGRVMSYKRLKKIKAQMKKTIHEDHHSDKFKIVIEEMATVRGFYHCAAQSYARSVILSRDYISKKYVNDLCSHLIERFHLEDVDADTRKLLDEHTDAFTPSPSGSEEMDG